MHPGADSLVFALAVVPIQGTKTQPALIEWKKLPAAVVRLAQEPQAQKRMVCSYG